MRAFALKALAVALTVLATFSFAAAPVSAQYGSDNPSSPTTGTEDNGINQANAAAADAAMYAAAASQAAANGDAAGAAVAAAKSQAAADKANAILASFKASGSSQFVIDQLAAAAAKATASAAAANASAGNVSVPAVQAPLPSLAFTGSSTSVPVALGAGLVGLGGLALLAARKREQQ